MSTSGETSTALSREPADVERRQAEAVRLYIRGCTTPQIAEELGIHPGTVRRYLQQAHQEWKSERIEALDELRDLERQRLLEVIRLAFIGWDKSERPALTEKTKAKQKGENVGGQRASEITTDRHLKHQCGDKGFLHIIKECSARICEMYGSDAPKQTQITGLDGGPITLANVLAIIQENPPAPPQFIDPNPPNVIDVESCAALIADPNFQPETIEGEFRAAEHFGTSEVEPFDEVLPDESAETDESEPGEDEPAGSEPDSESDGGQRDEPEEFVFR